MVNIREANKDLLFYLKSAFKWHFYLKKINMVD